MLKMDVLAFLKYQQCLMKAKISTNQNLQTYNPKILISCAPDLYKKFPFLQAVNSFLEKL